MILCALALLGARDRPSVALMTALPLIWGEGDAADILAGRTQQSPVIAALDKAVEIRAIDTIAAKTLANNVVLIAQPRLLTPTELVIFDDWVRRGGQALIFADPELVWPTRYPVGDARRAPPVTLLDPLFAHWGIALGDSDKSDRAVRIGTLTIMTRAAGRWRGGKTCTAPDPLVLDCRVGRGRAILVGDADLLDARLWPATGADNARWVVTLVNDLAGQDSESNDNGIVWYLAPFLFAVAITAAIWRRFRRT